MNDLQGSSLNYDKGRLQSEIFYLIVKHLRSFPDLKSSADALESKLVSSMNPKMNVVDLICKQASSRCLWNVI